METDKREPEFLCCSLQTIDLSIHKLVFSANQYEAIHYPVPRFLILNFHSSTCSNHMQTQNAQRITWMRKIRLFSCCIARHRFQLSLLRWTRIGPPCLHYVIWEYTRRNTNSACAVKNMVKSVRQYVVRSALSVCTFWAYRSFNMEWGYTLRSTILHIHRVRWKINLSCVGIIKFV